MTPYRQEARTRPDVLVCAGLDPSGGAGLLADARVISEHGGRPIGVVTTLTVQNTTGVIGSHPVDPEVVSHQLAFVMTDIEVHAVKIGMLGTAEVARALASTLQLTRAPVVWDPVVAPTLGNIGLDDTWLGEAVSALRPHLMLVTPNVGELAVLSGMAVHTFDEADAAARALAHELDCAVLVKGGHLGGEDSVDLLIHAGGREELRAPRVRGGETVHGTGCALSSAIATHLAYGKDLAEACRLAKHYVTARIADPAHPGRGAAAIL